MLERTRIVAAMVKICAARAAAVVALSLLGLTLLSFTAVAEDLLGNLEGVLDAELAQCDKIKKMSADELEAAKAGLSGRAASEQDVVNLKAAERDLEQARAHLTAAQDELADRITKLQLKAKSDIDYRQGKVNEILKQTAPMDARVKEIDGELVTLKAAIAEAMKKLEGDTFGVGKEPVDEKERVKALTAERTGLLDEMQPRAVELAPIKQELDALKAGLDGEVEKARASMKARIAGAEKEVARAQKDVDAVRARVGSGDAAVAAQLSRPGLLECIATREAELKVESGEGLGTSETSATTAAVTAGGPGDAVPQPAPGSQPFASAGLEGKAWSGTWEMGCKDPSTGKVERSSGVAEFRFAGSSAAVLFKKMLSEGDNDTPISVEFDPLGAFAYHYGDTGGEFGMSGQFQLAPAADGSMRPTGNGSHLFAMDFSWLAGLATSLGTLGMGGAGDVELTPEQREANMIRCNGTWTLPPG